MKKTLFFASMLLLLSVVFSCQRKGIKEYKGRVDALYEKTLTMVVDGDSIVFNRTAARYTNGPIMLGDSVIVRFTDSKSKDTIKALMIYLIPKAYHEQEFTDTLASAPATQEQIDDLNQFVNDAKKGK